MERYVVLIAIVLAAAPTFAQDVQHVDFAKQVLPLLSTNCFACHGPDAKRREAELRLDREDGAKESAIVPGNSSASELIERITSDDDDMHMPPRETGKQLTDDEIALLKRWIDQGAPWARHWAFVPPTSPPVPPVQSDWPRNEIDNFILARLASEALQPSSPAARHEWLRRVSFDLIGLPPTPQEADEFTSDTSPDAYEKVVDRLLRSPHYGERLAIDWLDLARFADTNGYQNDFNRSMWPWRDWVIEAFNQNMPADQFIVQQIAGDLLPNPTESQLIATGFNRNNRSVTEGGSIDEEWRVENVVDRVETTATTFLGLTMGCARCHDHKYDPITRRDFYQFFAFFNNVDEKGVYTETRGNVPPLIPVPTAEQKAKLADLDQRIAQLQHASEQVTIDVRTFFAGTAPPDSPGTAEAPQPPTVQSTLRIVLDQPLRFDGAPAAATAGQVPRYAGDHPTGIASPAGQGIEFSGEETSYVDAGQAFTAQANEPFAWSLWARTDRPGALLSKMDDNHAYRGVDTIVLEDYRLKVHLIDTWPGNSIAVTTKQPIPRESWCHLAISYDGSRKAGGVHVWLDGKSLELNIEQDSLQGEFATEQPLRIGRRSTSLYFDGAIADIRFYKQTLTTEQVDQSRRQQVRDQVATVNPPIAELPASVRDYLQREQGNLLRQQLQAVRDERSAFEKSIQTTMIMRDRADYRPTYALQRGQYDLPDQSETLWPEVPEFLDRLPEAAPRNRLALAQWLVQPSHPLVARVMVNRIWQRMFGIGIVATADNFGVQGDPPSHPELLDWLAIHFIESGWDIKQLHKLIALSATYRQTAQVGSDLMSRDPKNRLLARGSRHRLPAELVRDNALAVSGLLVRTVGGPSVKPYQPAGLWDELAGGANGGPYEVATDDNLYRRSLYTFRKRTVSHPTLSTFDAPSWEICQAKRAQTNTPLQALALLNDLTYVEAARHLGLRMMTEGGESLPDRVAYGFRLATLRQPSDDEITKLVTGYEKYFAYFRDAPDSAAAYLSQGVSQLEAKQKTPELAAMATVAAVLLNLDETITE